MVQFNFAERTIKAKVVYYGPPQSGKTTNLEQIHRVTDPAGTNRLISLNTAQDRTLFFDLLPFSLGAVAGYDFKVQLYTVPGQVQYNATRRVVLAGADAVVFVADSQRSMLKDNLSSFENMKVNLLANRLVPEKLPLVFQYNKRDLPDPMPAAELTQALNPWRRRAIPAVATRGDGVMDTFVAVVQEMLAGIAVKYNLKEKGLDPQDVPGIVAEAFATVLNQAAATPETSGATRVVVSQPADATPAVASATTGEAGLVSEELLHRAIRSNLDLAEALAGLVREMNLGLASILSHAELLQIYREDAREKRGQALRSIQEEATHLRRIVQGLGEARDAAVAAQRKPEASLPPQPTPHPLPSAVHAAAGASDAALKAALEQVVSGAGGVLASRALALDVQVPAGTSAPACPSESLTRIVGNLIETVAGAAPKHSSIALRCERKPVLMRGQNGDLRRDFLMLALAQQGALTSDEQNRLVQGDAGVAGGAGRLIKDLGGFVRFAPLPGGGLETRVFLPAG